MANMKTNLRMKCQQCGHWNRVAVEKIFVEQPSPEREVKVLIPMYQPLQTFQCEKCKKVITEPKELIRVVKGVSDV